MESAKDVAVLPWKARIFWQYGTTIGWLGSIVKTSVAESIGSCDKKWEIAHCISERVAFQQELSYWYHWYLINDLLLSVTNLGLIDANLQILFPLCRAWPWIRFGKCIRRVLSTHKGSYRQWKCFHSFKELTSSRIVKSVKHLLL